jgi:hypothetical protein
VNGTMMRAPPAFPPTLPKPGDWPANPSCRRPSANEPAPAASVPMRKGRMLSRVKTDCMPRTTFRGKALRVRAPSLS